MYARASAHYEYKALWTLTLAIGQISFVIPLISVAGWRRGATGRFARQQDSQ